MEKNPTRICELLVGLGDVEVLGVDDAPGGPLALHIRTRARPACGGCGGAVWSKGASAVGLVDLPAFGRPVRLVWRKWRWRCPAATCDVASFTEVDEQIAPARSALTARAGCWATVAVGRDARPVADVAAKLGCDWHTANRAVLTCGDAVLAADTARVGAVEALYFQCKRYRAQVPASAIRDFRGAMAGRGEKGLLVTTGTFTRGARTEASRDGAPPVELIDSSDLCDLLKEYELGVRTRIRQIEDVDIEAEVFAQFEVG